MEWLGIEILSQLFLFRTIWILKTYSRKSKVSWVWNISPAVEDLSCGEPRQPGEGESVGRLACLFYLIASISLRLASLFVLQQASGITWNTSRHPLITSPSSNKLTKRSSVNWWQKSHYYAKSESIILHLKWTRLLDVSLSITAAGISWPCIANKSRGVWW